MNPCWVLIITRGLRIWIPPEVYLQRELALREASRWRMSLRVPATPPDYSPTARCLHLIPTEFPEPWRACPVWLGLTWTVRGYPRARTVLMAADDNEAREWLARRAPRAARHHQTFHAEFQRRGIYAVAEVSRVKRVLGF